MGSAQLKVNCLADIGAGFGDPVLAVFVGLEWWLAVHGCELLDVCQADVGIDGVFPFQFATSISRQAAEDGGHGTLGTVLAFVRDNAVSHACEQIVVFLLVTASFPFRMEDHFTVRRVDLAATDVGVPFGAVYELADLVVAVRHVAALADHSMPIRIGKFNHVVVVNLTMILTISDKSSPLALGLDRKPIIEPVDHVEIMNVLLDDVVAADPVEEVPVSHLVFEFRLAFAAIVNPGSRSIPIHSADEDVANDALFQLLHRFFVRSFMSSLQANGDREVLFFGFRTGFQNTADPGSINSNRLLHEYVLAGIDGRFEMHRAESRRRDQQHHIDGRIEDAFVGIKANELVLVFDLGFLRVRFLAALQALIQAIFENVADGN